MAISITSIGSIAPSFLGKGLAFPFQVDPTTSRPLIASDEDLVLMSMMQIVNTQIGERPFLVKNGIPYGTRIRKVLFDTVDAAINVIQSEVKRAFDTWEPRIVTDLVTAQNVPQSEGVNVIAASVFFRFRSTNRSDNVVVPFRYQGTT